MNKNDQPDGAETNAGETYTVPAEGSLGLLALGAKGLDLWRKKRAAVIQNNPTPTPPADAAAEKK